ncbi:MAG: hypothetical protein WEC16_00415 [Anaerolineales bacterium]
MQAEVKQVEQRVKSHWFRDGLGEVVGGLMFILLGAYFSLVELLGESSQVGGLLQAGFIVVFLGLFYLGRRLILGLKTRYVVPRAGYVEYRVDREHQTRKRIGAGVFAAMIAAFTVFSIRLPGILNWLVVLTGLLVGLMLVLAQLRTGGIPRFFFLGTLSLLVGIAAGLTGLPDGYALGIYYSSMGVVFSVTGLLVLQSFLKKHPLQMEPADEK